MRMKVARYASHSRPCKLHHQSWKKNAGDKEFPNPKDIVFYEVALSKEGSFLVTGNTKHFPKVPIVVTPAEFLDILKNM